MKTYTHKGGRPLLSFLLCNAVILLMTTLAPPAKAEEQSLFFASDVHGNTARLSDFVGYADTEYEIDFYGLVGDDGIGQTTTDPEYNNILGILDAEKSEPSDKIYVLEQGNHDGPYYSDPTGEVQGLTGNDLFNVYVINTDDFDNPAVDVDNDLATYLKYYKNDKVLFILCHHPLHTTHGTAKEQERGLELFNTINDAVEQHAYGLDIVVLWGHNHRNENYDKDVRYIVTPGETVNETASAPVIPGIADVPFNFGYINAGYLLPMTVTEGGGPVDSSEPVFSSVVTVTDNKIIINRYAYPRDNNGEYHSENIDIVSDGSDLSDGEARYYRIGKDRDIGDVDGNMKVDINDALKIARYYVGLDPGVFYPEAADARQDGLIDIRDALVVARYYVGLVPDLPVLTGSMPVPDVTNMDEALEVIQSATAQ